MSVLGANLIASMTDSIKLDEKWESVVPMKTKHFLKEVDEDSSSYMVPNYSGNSDVEVNIMDCLKEKNRLILDSYRVVTLKYPDNALFEFNFDGGDSLQEVIHIIKSKSKLHGTSLNHYVTYPR